MRIPSALILVLASVSTAPASAQPSQPVDGVLASSVETGPTGGFVSQHGLPLQAGMQVTITLTSPAFDTYLIVRPPGGGAPIVNDDIAPDQLDSRVTFTAATSGVHTVAVSSYAPGATGPYRLIADFGQQGTPPSTPPAQVPVGPSQQLDGVLASSVETGPTGGFVSPHQLQIQAGQQVTIDLSSSAFDTYLIVRPPGGAAPIVNDDIADGQLDSRVTFTAAATGTYVLAVSSYEPGATGAYRLVARFGQQGTPPPSTPPTTGNVPVAAGQQIAGVLASSVETGPTGGFVAQHQVQLQAGQQVTIDLTSPAFDTYLIVRPPGGAAPIVNDDIAPGQLDSRVTFAAPATGTYTLAVSSYEPGATGAYQLVVR